MTLIRGGLVVDGTGAPARRADVLVDGDRIAAVGDVPNPPAGTAVIEAAGAVVAPGFIDAHTHDDVAALDGVNMAKLSQGVTTAVVGNCGFSLAPWTPSPARPLPPAPLGILGGPGRFAYPDFGSYLAALGGTGGRAPVVALCGHSSLRALRVADLGRPAEPDELAAMVADLEAALDAGCAGLSAGLAYPAAIASSTDEVTALARAAFRRGGAFAIHLRNEYDGVWDALDEAFAIARAAMPDSPEPGARLVLSHQKCAGPLQRGRASELLERIERASRDIPLAFDAYPYEAGSTLLEAESARASRRVIVTWSEPHPELAGLELSEAAERLGLDEQAAVEALKPGGGAYFHMDEADVDAILAHPLCMVGSDGLPADAVPHPRLYGAFPRYFGRMVREKRLLGLEEALRKVTSLPAAVFSLGLKGVLREGADADIVVFEPELYRDRADWREPRRYCEGVRAVLRRGELRSATRFEELGNQ
ncbi:MAG: D-aminoacylase [Spirochaetaceae bacterium]|nr:D-aminoacylase [Spirochaetaceae bacterium]